MTQKYLWLEKYPNSEPENRFSQANRPIKLLVMSVTYVWPKFLVTLLLVTLSQLSLNKFCIFEKLLNKWILQETFQQFAKMGGQNRVHQILADQWPFACPPTFRSISIWVTSKHLTVGNISEQAENGHKFVMFPSG